MAVKQTTTENEEKLPISRILDFINEHEQRIIRDYSHIAKQIVELLGCIDQPKDGSPFIKQITDVDEYLRKISEQVDITRICSTEIQNILKMDNPSAAAGIILHRLETVRMPKFYEIFVDKQDMIRALNNLFSWMKFSFFIRNLDNWILKVMNDLQENKMYSILLEVSSKHMAQIACLMLMPITRKQAEPIFFNVLTSVQHTPIIFDRVAKKANSLLDYLRGDTVLQQRMVDTIKALIDHFNTFPLHDDYSEIEDLISKNYSVSSNYKQILETKPWHDTSPSYQYISANVRVGLENLGNTCYMNSILQALTLTKNFRHEMLFFEIKSNLFQLLQELMAMLLHSTRPTLSPKQILKEACPPSFQENHQQDCSEFLGHLLESLHTAENKYFKISSENNMPLLANDESSDASNMSMDTSSASSSIEPQVASRTLVQKTFDGSISIVHRCLNCGTTSRQNDSFRDLHLSFPDTETNSKGEYSVEDLLRHYCLKEKLDADNKYSCDTCDMLCDGERFINIVNPPLYLVLTLKYFKYDKENSMRTKLTHKVKLKPKISVKISSEDGNSKHNVHYRLYAAVVHSGYSMDSGHYYTYGSDQPDGASWYKFNDSCVTDCDISELEGLRSPNTPYVLFYEREYDGEQLAEDPINGCDDNMHPALDGLPSRLRNYVVSDNNRHEMEKRLRKPKANSVNNFSYNFSSDNNDDDNPPPTNCGGNQFAGSNPYIC